MALAYSLGHFVVRESKSQKAKYALSVRGDGSEVLHLSIHQNSSGDLYLDSAQTFHTLLELVDHYMENGLPSSNRRRAIHLKPVDFLTGPEGQYEVFSEA